RARTCPPPTRSRASSSASCANRATEPARSALGGGQTPPVAPPAADRRRRTRLEVLAEDPLADLEHGALDPLGIVGLGRRRDLLGLEHVAVTALGWLAVPCPH